MLSWVDRIFNKPKKGAIKPKEEIKTLKTKKRDPKEIYKELAGVNYEDVKK